MSCDHCLIFFPFLYVEVNGIGDCLKLLWHIHRDLMVMEQLERWGVSFPLVPPELDHASPAAI